MRLLHVIRRFFPDCHPGAEHYCLALVVGSRAEGVPAAACRGGLAAVDVATQPAEGL